MTAQEKYAKKGASCHPNKPLFSRGLCCACWTRKKWQSDPDFRKRRNAARSKWKRNHPKENAAAMLRWYYKNHEENKRKRREYIRANPHIIKRAALRRYGMTISDYDVMFVKQNGLCALCGLEEKNGKLLSVDHCHTSGKIRALLCGSCNGGLGLFDDDISVLQKAIEYLTSHQQKE